MPMQTGNSTVDKIGQMHFEGNVIPHMWYQEFKFENGKPDLVSILLLADFVYWYRPTYIRNEQTGMLEKVKTKFAADLLQKSYKELENQFGFSDKQIRESLKRLEAKRLVQRVFRTIETEKTRLNNVMFIAINPERIFEITFPQQKQGGNDTEGNTLFPSGEGGYFPPGKEGVSLQGNTNTEITITEITTNKSSSNSHQEKEEKPFPEKPEMVILKFWDMNGFGFNNLFAKNQLLKYLDEGYEPELLIRAMEIAAENDNRKIAYIHGIFREWEKNEVRTVAQADAHAIERRNKKKLPMNRQLKKDDIEPKFKQVPDERPLTPEEIAQMDREMGLIP